MNKAKSKSNKNKAFFRLGLWFLAILTLVLVGAAGYKAVKSSVWDGQNRLGLIDLSRGQIELINYLPAEKKEYIWTIPADLAVDVPFGYGRYQLRKVFQLGELDGIGEPLLLRTTSNLFGLKIDAFKLEGKTNLSWWDRLRINFIGLTKSWQTTRLDLTGQIGRLDQIVNENLFDSQLAKEAIAIAVLNASGEAGEANLVTRLITNLGGHVVTIGNSDQPEEQSEIWVGSDDLKNSVTLKFLKAILGPVPVKLESNLLQYRSDIVVVVGRDYATLP